MSEIVRDPVMGVTIPLADGETVVAELAPDASAYWRSHAVMAIISGVGAGFLLMAMGNTSPWVGPLAAFLAIGARAAYLRSEAMAEVWRLTDRRLIGPGGRVMQVSAIRSARPFLGAVQVVTTTGDKHLIKYQADPAGIADRLDRLGRTGPGSGATDG